MSHAAAIHSGAVGTPRPTCAPTTAPYLHGGGNRDPRWRARSQFVRPREVVSTRVNAPQVARPSLPSPSMHEEWEEWLDDVQLPVRRALPHGTPPERRSASTYHLITCTRPRGRNQLCRDDVANLVRASLEFHDGRGAWRLHACVLMPDHVHLIATVPAETRLAHTVAYWKRYVARQRRRRVAARLLRASAPAGRALRREIRVSADEPGACGIGRQRRGMALFLDVVNTG